MTTPAQNVEVDEVAPGPAKPKLARLAWSVEEVAISLDLSEDLVRKMCRRGDVRAIKPGKEWRIPDVELQRLLGSGVAADESQQDVA